MAEIDTEYAEGDSGSEAADAPGAIPAEDTGNSVAERIKRDASSGFESTVVTDDIAVVRRPGKNARAAESRKAFAEAILASKKANAELTTQAAPAKPADEFDPEADPAPAAAAAAVAPKPPIAPKPAATVAPEATVTAAPAPTTPPPAPSLDPEVRKLREEMKAAREQLAAELEKAKAAAATPAQTAAVADAMNYEDYVDRPSSAYRNWLETMRGEKFASEDEFKLEARDFITSIGADVLGVTLSDIERNSLETRMARKAVRVSKTVASKREQEAAARAERERAEAETKAQTERIEQEWSKAAEQVSAMFSPIAGADGKPAQSAAAAAYPWLATVDDKTPGEVVVDVIRAAMAKDGTQLSWQEASKKANDYLEAEWKRGYAKRQALLSPAAPVTPKPTAKPAAPTPSAPAISPSQRVNPSPVDTNGKFSKDKHRENTLAAYRAAFQPKT